MPFQTAVNRDLAAWIEGDFLTANPWWNVDAGPGTLVVDPTYGLTAGRFAWIDPTGAYARNFGSGMVAGFVHRDLMGLNMTYGSETSMGLLPGSEATLYNGGEFAVRNTGGQIVYDASRSTVLKAYANYGTGLVTFAATGNPPAGAVGATGSIGASFTASIAATTLTVTAVASGVITPGGSIPTAGVAAGTTIGAQLTGTAGGVGTYTVSISQTVASQAMTETATVLTVTTAPTGGAFTAGQPIAGTGVATGTAITSLGTGTGGVGSYNLSGAAQTVAPTTVTSVAGVETKFYLSRLQAGGTGAPNEVVGISSHTLG